MALADPPKKASTFERMNDRPQLFFSNKMAHDFIEWMTPSGLFKKMYYTYKKFDTSHYSTPKEN